MSSRRPIRTHYSTSTRHLLGLFLLIIVMGCQRGPGPPTDLPLAPTHITAEAASAANASGPTLTLLNEYMDPVVSTSVDQPLTTINIPAGVPLLFCWTADASTGGEGVEAYRYAWDIVDLGDPELWDIGFTPFDGSRVCASARTFFFGTHTFHVEVADNLDRRSRVGIRINVIFGPPSFDILPGSCKNPLSPHRNGVIPAAIPGTPALDVATIDLSTIRLWINGNTVQPVRSDIRDVTAPVINGDVCDCTSHGPDGIDDLYLKFSAKDLIDALGPVSKGQVREIEIRGALVGGLEFSLQDCVLIVGGAMGDPPPLQTRDEVLTTLRIAYNEKSFADASIVFDAEFTFFFSAADVQAGDVSVAQWGREGELVATASLFNVASGGLGSEKGKRVLAGAIAIEQATWGRIKHVFFESSAADETSIGLSLFYPVGDDSWTSLMPSDPDKYPDEVWFEKTANYVIEVQSGETSFISGAPRRASFVVRLIDVDGSSIWQLVQWRDDI
ncbi:MAG: hypothetical protein OEN01_03460 [Candidatus Krumholzibacteria bacterium]|nr:hypothetical protein [Candidatus Krumholzibacteria bacterium]